MPNPPLEELLRIEGGRVLATLIRLTGDIDLAEDAVQDAVLVALERWSDGEVPRNPGAWLTTVARNKALDRLRREQRRPARERAVDWAGAPDGGTEDRVHAPDAAVAGGIDDQLRLLFTCCHPALSFEARIALALRTIAGLRTDEIARAFLVPEPTIGQRISRAKRKIAVAAIPYRVPADHELPERLPAVLQVVSAVFTTGHNAPAGALDARVDLADEGVRLARWLVALMPDEPECAGLLALTLATHARRRARLDGYGDLVRMVDQDRSRWDHAAIDEAARLTEATLRRRRPGPFQIKAAIACLHGVASTYATTDWAQIAELYERLEAYEPTSVVRLNRVVAVVELGDLPLADALLQAVDATAVANWHLYWTVRADIARRVGRHDESLHALDRALQCPMNDAERRLLERRRAGRW